MSTVTHTIIGQRPQFPHHAGLPWGRKAEAASHFLPNLGSDTPSLPHPPAGRTDLRRYGEAGTSPGVSTRTRDEQGPLGAWLPRGVVY